MQNRALRVKYHIATKTTPSLKITFRKWNLYLGQDKIGLMLPNVHQNKLQMDHKSKCRVAN